MLSSRNTESAVATARPPTTMKASRGWRSYPPVRRLDLAPTVASVIAQRYARGARFVAGPCSASFGPGNNCYECDVTSDTYGLGDLDLPGAARSVTAPSSHLARAPSSWSCVIAASDVGPPA